VLRVACEVCPVDAIVILGPDGVQVAP
jgi:hypothetical protein